MLPVHKEHESRRDASPMCQSSSRLVILVICHTPTAIRRIFQKLISQYTGPYKIVSKFLLTACILAPNVFDLDYALTGRKMEGVNITPCCP